MQSGPEGFQQRGSFEIHRGRHQVRIADRRNDVFRECAAKMRRRRAQMETSTAAGAASAAMPERIERDMIAGLVRRYTRAHFHDLARGFVADDGRKSRDHAIGAKFPFVDVEVRAADSARSDLHQQLPGAGFTDRDIDDLSAECRLRFGDRLHLHRASVKPENSALEKKALAQWSDYSQWRSGTPR